jgi:hypothetical protein
VVGEGEPELEHPEEQEEDDRDGDRQLDQALAALAGAGVSRAPGQASEERHRIGSIRIELALTIV